MGRKIPQGLHDCAFKLFKLLSQFHSDEFNVSEEDFQEYFEEYKHPWKVLGYDVAFPEPKFDLIVEDKISGDYINPDFVARNEIKNRWEIVDLKLPMENLLLNERNRRIRFKSEISDYVSQVHEYRNYFDEKAHRDHVESKLGISIPKNPPTVLIMGSGIEQDIIDAELKRYNDDITVYQYDHILDLITNELASYSGKDRLSGISINTRLMLISEPEENREYIFDIGHLESDRVGIYLSNDGSLNLEINPKNGTPLSVSVPWREILELGEAETLYAEFGTSEELSFARLFAGSQILDEMLVTAEVPFDLLDGEHYLYVGSDLEGHQGAQFGVNEILIYDAINTLEERISEIQRLKKKYDEDPAYVVYEKDDYQYTTRTSSDLTQEDVSKVPMMVESEEIMEEFIKRN